MAKKKKEDSLIALELDKFESKIIQFQNYLEVHDIRDIYEDKKRHDEVDCQIKIMNNLPGWLAAYERLLEEKEEEVKKIEVRGEGEMSGLMQQKSKSN